MRRALPSRTAVLDVLRSADRAMHSSEVAEKLGVGPESAQGLLRLLDDLVFDGAVIAQGERFKLDRQQARASGRGKDRRQGNLTVNPRGFGFVASPTAAGDDVFVNADSLGGAMHGDQVIVEIVARGSRGPEGQIVEITKRGTTRVSGILRRRGKSAWIDLDDPRIKGPVVLTREIDTRGPEGNSGLDGQVVVAEITRFPDEPGETPEGRIIAVLGQPGELSVEVNKVLFLEKIDEVHTSAAIAEAEAYGTEVAPELLADREDLTGIPLPTIDPEDARDHDDAVWVERTDTGGYEVWVAIADVSSYVRPNTQIDEEARRRGCSIYLPDRAIPMLPRALSSNLCSLLPDVLRLCLCVHAELDAKGTVKRARLVRGVMKSAAKLTYGGVARALGFTDQPPRQEKAEEMVDGLRVAYECSRVLRGLRMKRGALDFDLPEPVIKLDSAGKPVAVTKRTKDEGVKKAYQLIEELMIFANEVVARWLIEHELPGTFRVHLPPDSKKLERLATMCEVLGIEIDLDDAQTPKGLQSILESFADHPNAQVLNSLLLRSMKQATYDVQNLGHFGLASTAYLHFTSPIRRYPDLVDHRIIHAALLKEKRELARVTDRPTLEQAALDSSTAERRAMEVEREILDIYRCFYMIDRIGERFEGTISAFVGSGAFVTLDDPFVDVLVRTEDMGGEFVIDDDGLMATNSRSGDSLHLGERILVEIIDVAILRRQVQARLIRGDGQDDGERKPFRGRDQGRRGPERTARGPERSARGPERGAGPRGGTSGRTSGPPARGTKKTAAKSGGKTSGPSRKNKGGPSISVEFRAAREATPTDTGVSGEGATKRCEGNRRKDEGSEPFRALSTDMRARWPYLSAVGVLAIGVALALTCGEDDEPEAARAATNDGGARMGPDDASKASKGSSANDGGGVLSPSFVDRDINHVLGTGQSLSVGAAGTPPLSTSQPYANLMFSPGTLAGSENLTKLVPLVEGNPSFPAASAETMSSGFANLVTKMAREELLVEQPTGKTSHDLLVSLHGISGTAYTGLKKGTPAYASGIAQARAALAAAKALGKSYVVRAVTNVHGETDHENANVAYAQNLVEWQSDYEKDVRAITGQSETVPMLHTQMSSWTRYGQATSAIPAQQLATHITSNGKIVLVGPKYHLPYVADGVHLTNHGYRQMGEDYAKVYRRVILEGKPWEPLRPTSITRSGAVITVRFVVPAPPLVLDEAIVTNPGSFGFEYTDGSGAAPRIASVSIAGPDTVTIALAATPTGANKRLRYAFTGTPDAAAGARTGPRGNLRDSDEAASRNGYPLFNWCVHFDEAVP